MKGEESGRQKRETDNKLGLYIIWWGTYYIILCFNWLFLKDLIDYSNYILNNYFWGHFNYRIFFNYSENILLIILSKVSLFVFIY